MAECYLCGEILIKNKNKSKDHIPPKCIFPEKKPFNLITAPCCKTCNDKFSPIDERMRNYFSVIAEAKSNEVGYTAKRVIQRSKRLRSDFLSHITESPIVDSFGRPLYFFHFKDEELKNELIDWLKRIVKGLYFKKHKIRISDNADYEVKLLPEIKPQESKTFPMEEGLEFRPYFVYKVSPYNNTTNTDFWMLIFHDRIVSIVIVKKSSD